MSSPLERIYDKHAQALFAFLLNFTRNEADTQDVMQEIFRKIATRPELTRGALDERAYLLKLAHNSAVDLMRRNAVREKNRTEYSTQNVRIFAEDTQDGAVFRQALSDALAELPPEQRAVAHLKLWEGATFEQIAVTLGIPANTAASRYRYAIDKLREKLRPIYEEINDQRRI